MNKKGSGSRFIVLPFFILRLKQERVLNAEDVLLLGLIVSLSVEDGYCYASNRFLADYLGLSKQTIADKLVKFRKLGLIEVEVDRDENGVVKQRRVFVKFDIKPVKQRGGYSLYKEEGISCTKNRYSLYKEVDNKNKDNSNNTITTACAVYGNRFVNFLLSEVESVLGKKLPTKFGKERHIARAIVELLTRNGKNGPKRGREWLSDDIERNIKDFLKTVARVVEKKRLNLNYLNTLHDWAKLYIAEKGRRLFGVESEWYVRWKRKQEIEATKKRVKLDDLPTSLREKIRKLARNKGV